MNTVSEPSEETPLHIIRRFTQYWRNDYLGSEQYSSFHEDAGKPVTLPALKRRHEEFARVWDNNLRAQGYYEAFQHSRKQ